MTGQPEVTAIDHLLRIMDERDCRYTQRFDAQEKALKVALDKAEGTQASVISWLSLLMAAVAVAISVTKL